MVFEIDLEEMEEFKFSIYVNHFRINRKEIEYKEVEKGWVKTKLVNISMLVEHPELIEKLPYKPTNYKDYYYIDRSGKSSFSVCCKMWNNTLFDMLNYKAGNTFKTDKICYKNKDKMAKEIFGS